MTTPYFSPPIFSWPAAPGGKLHTYLAGGTTPQATYSDAAGVTPNTNPVTLDSLGSAVVRLAVGVAYHFVLKDPTDVTTLWDADNFDNAYVTSTTVGTALYPQTAAELAAGVTPTNFSYPPLDIRRYGADLTGVADSSTAIINALKSVPANGGNVFCSAGGTITVNALVQLDLYSAYNNWTLDFTGLQINTTLTSGTVFKFGDTVVKAAAQNVILRGGYYNINNTAVDAFAIYRCQNLILENIRVFKANRAFHVDGTFNASGRILDLKFKNTYTANSNVGYRFNAQNPLLGSYDMFLMDTCSSESDATGVAVIGYPSNPLVSLKILNSEIQNSSTAGVSCSQGEITLSNTFIQTSSVFTVPSISATNSSIVQVVDGSAAAYPSIDATSFVNFKAGTTNEFNTVLTECRLSGGALGDNDAVNGWGPPNYPQSKPGFHALLGHNYRDSQGIDWTCTVAGTTSGGAPFVKYMPLADPCEIVIPVAYNTNLTNGNLIWFPQMDFVVEEVMLLVTTAFLGGTSIQLATAAGNSNGLISSDTDQGALANLTLGKFITSRRNRNAGALLAGGNTLIWAGNEYNASSGTVGANGLYSFVTGTFTAGAGKLIVRGYRPRVTTAGVTLAGAQISALTNQTATTVGAAGAATALPANPLKYLTVIDATGTLVKIPAYNP